MRCSLLALFLASAPLAGQTYAFTNVNVVPMDRDRVLENQTVVVTDGRITALGPAGATTVPEGATRIDGRRQWLLPGLAEMHAHVPPQQAPEAYTSNILFLYVANGVTTIRGMLGQPAHLELRRHLESGAVLGPRLWTSGPSVNGNSVPNADSAVRTVAWQQAQGFDFMKIHPGLGRAAFDSLDAAADRLGFRYAGHVPAEVGVRRALEAGYWSIDHLDGYIEEAAGASGGWFGIAVADRANEAILADLVRITAAAGVWNVPTQTLMESYAADATPEEMAARYPEIRYMPPQTRQQWMNWKANANQNAPAAHVRERYLALRYQLIRDLYRQTGRVLLGSDAPQVWNVPGFSAIHELETYVTAGLTPFEALTTGTTAVARNLGVADQQGTVAIGMRADLILLGANPLDDVANVRQRNGVMIRGRWLPRAAIEERLERIAAEYAN
jgi:imidazolonepropionase-like amidohydrolase